VTFLLRKGLAMQDEPPLSSLSFCQVVPRREATELGSTQGHHHLKHLSEG